MHITLFLQKCHNSKNLVCQVVQKTVSVLWKVQWVLQRVLLPGGFGGWKRHKKKPNRMAAIIEKCKFNFQVVTLLKQGCSICCTGNNLKKFWSHYLIDLHDNVSYIRWNIASIHFIFKLSFSKANLSISNF